MGVLSFPPIAALVLELRDKFRIRTLVETGTYRGESTQFAAQHFEKVITLDIREDFQAQGRERCRQFDNITYLIGDSRDLLPKIVEQLEEPALFWLDAHSVAGMFGPEDDCPILEELDTINRSEFKHCILIDDLHCFIPPLPHDAKKWPEAWAIYQKGIAGGYTIRTGHDIAVLVPPRARPILDQFSEALVGFEKNEAHADIKLDSLRLHKNLNPVPTITARGTAHVGHAGPPVPEPKDTYTEILKTAYGIMLCPRYDTNQTAALRGGYALDHARIMQFQSLLEHKRPGAVFVDVGCNVGTFSFALQPICAKVFCFEAQRIIYNMVCGSIALNGWQNVFATNVALSDKIEKIEVPQFDYNKPCSFGSIEFDRPEQREHLLQERRYSLSGAETVPTAPLDYFQFPRLDILKIDVEGMELKVISGGWQTITTHRPIIYIEHTKSNRRVLAKRFEELNYELEDTGDDFFCTPRSNY
jgi:FkbM family methyltransferase